MTVVPSLLLAGLHSAQSALATVQPAGGHAARGFSFDYQNGITYGLIYGIAAIGLSLPLRYLRSADLTTIASMIVGGVVCVAIANVAGTAAGLVGGIAAAGLLGAATAVMSGQLGIPVMLASVITLIASQSIALLVTGRGGSIDLNGPDYLLDSTFSWRDVLKLMLPTCLVVAGLGLWARSKWGTGVAFLLGSDRFVRFRHRSSELAGCLILVTANGIVGLAGALMALRTKQGHAQSGGLEFIAIAFGAIFAGDAAVRLVARLLKKETATPVHVESGDAGVTGESLATRLRIELSGQRTEAARLWFVLATYVTAAILLNTVTQSVRGQTLGPIEPEFEHLLVAGIILLGLWASSLRRGDE